MFGVPTVHVYWGLGLVAPAGRSLPTAMTWPTFGRGSTITVSSFSKLLLLLVVLLLRPSSVALGALLFAPPASPAAAASWRHPAPACHRTAPTSAGRRACSSAMLPQRLAAGYSLKAPNIRCGSYAPCRDVSVALSACNSTACFTV